VAFKDSEFDGLLCAVFDLPEVVKAAMRDVLADQPMPFSDRWDPRGVDESPLAAAFERDELRRRPAIAWHPTFGTSQRFWGSMRVFTEHLHETEATLGVGLCLTGLRLILDGSMQPSERALGILSERARARRQEWSPTRNQRHRNAGRRRGPRSCK
jgi:hypothetical protein